MNPYNFDFTDPTYVQFRNWLQHLGAEEYLNFFVTAGYDIAFIKQHGLNEADLECVGIPLSKRGLRKKLLTLHKLDLFYTEDEEEGDGDEEEDGEGNDGDEDEDEED